MTAIFILEIRKNRAWRFELRPRSGSPMEREPYLTTGDQVDDRQVGLLVASGSKNPPSTWLHARDYGLVVTNPFPRQPKERREPFIKTKVKKGIPFRLSYAVLVHDLPHSKELDREAFFLEMLTALDSLPPLEGQQAKSPR